MKKRIVAISAGAVLAAAVAAAQSGGGFGGGGGFGASTAGGGGGRGGGGTFGAMEFQQAGSLAAARPTTNRAPSGPLVVAGRPFSATEERKFVQTLGDGTEISTTETNLLYRDSQGRTRVEQDWNGKTVIAIMDPVARFVVHLDPVARTARKSPIPNGVNQGGISISGGVIGQSYSFNSEYRTGEAASAVALNGVFNTTVTARGGSASGSAAAGAVAGGRGARGGGGGGAVATTLNGPTTKFTTEELGALSQNGVVATGTRNTTTIPQGQIGNNRDIHIVNERWYSDDLQLLVKSINSDPRFGDNTYQLTKVSRDEPPAALFQIPADYQLVENPPTAPRVTLTPVIK